MDPGTREIRTAVDPRQRGKSGNGRFVPRERGHRERLWNRGNEGNLGTPWTTDDSSPFCAATACSPFCRFHVEDSGHTPQPSGKFLIHRSSLPTELAFVTTITKFFFQLSCFPTRHKLGSWGTGFKNLLSSEQAVTVLVKSWSKNAVP
jgi:hypothetical protein